MEYYTNPFNLPTLNLREEIDKINMFNNYVYQAVHQLDKNKLNNYINVSKILFGNDIGVYNYGNKLTKEYGIEIHNRKIHFFIVKNKKDKYSYAVTFIKNHRRLKRKIFNTKKIYTKKYLLEIKNNIIV